MVLVILWLALHSAKIIFAVFVNLFVGLSITTAVGLMMVGSLNLLSVAFAVLFVGLGVDFGIQFSVRYRSERFKNDDLQLALESAAGTSAVPLSLAATATAAGFLSFLPTDYKGVSELGKIAGAGMLIAFITSITVLPALLTCSIRPAKREPVGYAFLAPVDRFPGKASRRHHRRHAADRGGRPAAALFPEVRLQPDQSAQPEGQIDRDLPRPAQGPEHRRQRHQRDDEFGSGRRKIEARLEKVPEVLRVMSLDSFVPEDQPAKLKLIAQAAKVVGPALNPDSVERRPPTQENVDALKSSVDSLRKTAGDGKGPGAIASRRLADALSKLAESNQATRDKAQAIFVTPLKVVLDQLKNTLQAQPVTLKTLPPELVAAGRPRTA